MSSNTPNLGLLKKDPIADGNETFNIQTMLNDNWDKIDAAVKAVEDGLDNVSVPDATLTQKGIVQLSSATDSTSEAMAATPKAVKAAYDRGSAGVTAAAAAQAKADAAIPKAIPDTRSVPTKPSDYSKSVAYSFKSGAAVGLPAEQYVVIHGFKGWNDDSGGVTHEYASGGTTGAMYHRTGTSTNDTWAAWMQIIDNGAPWQQRKLTENNGLSINISNGNANNLTAAGFYVGENVANAPTTGPGAWWYIEVQAMDSANWVLQKAYDLFSPGSFRMRIRSNGTWTAWSDDLFTSVANGKSGIANAISGKNVPTSPTDSFATMAANIGKIKTTPLKASGTATSSSSSVSVTTANGTVTQTYTLTVNGLSFTPSIIALVTSANAVVLYFPQFDFEGRANEDIVAMSSNGFVGYTLSSGGAYVNSSGFCLPVTFAYPNTAFRWYAYE